jgi:hypothetical protein
MSGKTRKRTAVIWAALWAAPVLLLLAAQGVAAQGVVVPLRKAAPADPCIRPAMYSGYGGGGGEEIRLLEPADSSALLLELTGHSAWVSGVAYGAGSDLILTKGGDGIGLWDAYTGEQIDFFTDAKNAAVSPDGVYSVRAYREEDGQITLHVATAGDDLYSAPLPDRLPAPAVMQFTQDGSRLVLVQNGADTTSRTISRVLIWDVARAEIEHTLAGVLATTPATATVASRWQEYVQNGQVSLVRDGHAGRITDVALSADERLLATASDDGTVRVWDLRTGAPRGCIEVSPAAFVEVVSVAFDPDGQGEISAIWQTVDPEQQEPAIHYAAWRISDGERQRAIRLQTSGSDWSSDLTNAVFGGETAFSPDLTRWVTPAGKLVLLWNLEDGSLAELVRQPGEATAAAYAPDGATFVTAYNYPNDIEGPIYGALLWDATHPDLADGAATEKLVLQAIPLLKEGNTAAARPLLRRAAAINPFSWYDPVSDAEVRAGLKEADDGSVRGVVRARGRVNVREAPQADARIITQLANGAVTPIYARSPDGQWLVTQVVDGEYGRLALAWVMARYVALDGNVEDLPVKEP